jgi:hypothetical protein
MFHMSLRINDYWATITAARVPYQVKTCGICGGQRGNGTLFLRVLPFLLPILIPHH